MQNYTYSSGYVSVFERKIFDFFSNIGKRNDYVKVEKIDCYSLYILSITF